MSAFTLDPTRSCLGCGNCLQFSLPTSSWQCSAALLHTGPDEFRQNPEFPSIFCTDLRGSSGPCGPEGKLWIPLV